VQKIFGFSNFRFFTRLLARGFLPLKLAADRQRIARAAEMNQIPPEISRPRSAQSPLQL
jgi:hypothetical protein